MNKVETLKLRNRNDLNLPQIEPLHIVTNTNEEILQKIPKVNPMQDNAEELVNTSKLRKIADRAVLLVSKLAEAAEVLVLYRMVDS